MKLRPYQEEFVFKSINALEEHRRVMSVCATGGGKTIMASELIKREAGNCLFLADAEELINQNAQKYYLHTGEVPGVEKGKSRAYLGVDRVVMATSQTLWRRLSDYPEDYFNLIISDEAHRNTLGAMSQKILKHFGQYAKVLGMTATPFRSDRKKLGDFYETIAVDIPLNRLITEGYLSRIMIKGVPLNIDLSIVRKTGADYNATDLSEAVEPHLVKAAELLRATIKEHDRKGTVVFLPLVKTSKQFVDILCGMGVKAVHVDGEDKSALKLFETGKAEVICNASLLTTGWDCPHVDCVYILRPTKSLSLYSQMVGRGTRIHKGKDHVLLLDPLYLHEDHRLITPARLVATTEKEAAAIMAKIREGENACGLGDLLSAEEKADADREASLKEKLEETKTRDSKLIDAMEYALEVGDIDTADYEPSMKWEEDKPSVKQLATLEGNGFNTDTVTTRGQAAKLLDLIFTRREKGFATPKQVRLMKQLKHPNPLQATFEDASAWLDNRFKTKVDTRYTNTAPITAMQMVKLRARGIDPASVKSRDDAERLIKETVCA